MGVWVGRFVPAAIILSLVVGSGPTVVAEDRPQPTGESIPPVDFEERVSLVNVYATVRDRGGKFVMGLSSGDFQVFEDGVPQTLTHFAVDDLPLHVVLLVDSSHSMVGKKIDTARKAAEKFARTLRFPRDRAMIIAISNTPEVVQDWTSSLGELSQAIRRLTAHGTTALYDSLLLGVEQLRGVTGRKVVILLSDGLDRPGSVVTFNYALDAAKRAEVMVYSIGLGHQLWASYDIFGERSAEDLLNTLSFETGGTSFYAARPGQLKTVYRQVADELQHQYGLAYVSRNEARDGSWREVEVSTSRRALKVVHRPGYYASDQ